MNWYQRLLYNGELIDQRGDNVLFESQEYFIHEIDELTNQDLDRTYILPQLNYLNGVWLLRGYGNSSEMPLTSWESHQY